MQALPAQEEHWPVSAEWFLKRSRIVQIAVALPNDAGAPQAVAEKERMVRNRRMRRALRSRNPMQALDRIVKRALQPRLVCKRLPGPALDKCHRSGCGTVVNLLQCLPQAQHSMLCQR